MATEVDFIVADLDLFTRLEIIALSTNVDANLRENPPGGTPVDTGWARASWVPSVGAPSQLSGETKDSEATPAEVAARENISRQGLNDLLSWKAGDGAIFVTNNTPYIIPLNNGHSAQSPAGFVQVAVEKALIETYSAGATKAQRNRRASAARQSKRKPK